MGIAVVTPCAFVRSLRAKMPCINKTLLMCCFSIRNNLAHWDHPF